MSKDIKVVRTVKDLRKQIAKWRSGGKTIALVPTMGALHDGHLSLVELAAKKSDKVVVSIFVNPRQFGPKEDLAHYPRDEAADLLKLSTTDANLVWAPGVEEMYADGFATQIVMEGPAEPLEGEFRPHHFGGVGTVCCKLFNQVSPDIAIFGEKDYQQLCVLRQMVRDLNLPLTLIGAPTKRAADGLAMSSRNAYLTAPERKIAPVLYATISELANDIAKGADVTAACAAAKLKLRNAGFQKIDYLDVCDAQTLRVASGAQGESLRILVAAFVGKTRLIDNVAVP